ncbi:hypothetical protein BZG36_02521 [Bifiguratus adelaidae]|uniref:Uncharacterized protein n=1 Tax=Bifiguratus adelaidae TaxID=1938954 RepID=A0A261Y2S0_9FUNG|nr:hypothetical protein BZG36_02521 [Bifiguratus adelaidae]
MDGKEGVSSTGTPRAQKLAIVTADGNSLSPFLLYRDIIADAPNARQQVLIYRQYEQIYGKPIADGDSAYTLPINSDESQWFVATDRFQRLVLEDIYFIVFVAVMGVLGIDALLRENTIQLIAFTSICVLNVVFAIVQILEAITWIDNLKDPLYQGIDVQPLTRSKYLAAGLTTGLGLMAMALAWSGWKLIRELGWKIYRRIGADLRLQRVYKIYQLYTMVLKLALFFTVFFNVFWFILLLMIGPDSNSLIPGGTREYQWVHLGILIANLFGIIAGWRGIHVESILLMNLANLTAAAIIANFIYIFLKFGTFWVVWDFVMVMGIIECVAIITLSIMAMRNFRKGLKESLRSGNVAKQYRANYTIESDTDLPAYGLSNSHRFSIDQQSVTTQRQLSTGSASPQMTETPYPSRYAYTTTDYNSFHNSPCPMELSPSPPPVPSHRILRQPSPHQERYIPDTEVLPTDSRKYEVS